MQTIFPILHYNDARAAIQWLCNAFGFTQIFTSPESGEYVRHAQLSIGTNRIMIGSCREDGNIQSPLTLGTSTQALCVYVPDVVAHFKQAQSAGAQILVPLRETDFGAMEYHVQDCEGHLWTFGTFLPSTE